jgi:3-hydroxyisobutyrate dehydrogenase-like beta-hydroxyacid dehydrogenase
MGKHMAASLIKAGHHVTVHDARPDAFLDPVLDGAAWAGTPRAVAEASTIVIASLPGPYEVSQVVTGADGVLSGASPGDVFIDMSTSTPTAIRAIAELAAAQDVEVVDAPVAGGIRGARKRTLTIMVGAHAAVFERCEPILRAMGEQIFLVGDVGAGHAAKLVNNMMTIVNALAAMEAMVVGAKAGVNVETLLKVVQAGTGSSYSLNLFPYVIFKRNFEPAKFALSLAAKDLRLSVEFAENLGIPLTVVESGYAALRRGLAEGLGDKDWSSYITLLEQAAGVEVHP